MEGEREKKKEGEGRCTGEVGGDKRQRENGDHGLTGACGGAEEKGSSTKHGQVYPPHPNHHGVKRC